MMDGGFLMNFGSVSSFCCQGLGAVAREAARPWTVAKSWMGFFSSSAPVASGKQCPKALVREVVCIATYKGGKSEVCFGTFEGMRSWNTTNCKAFDGSGKQWMVP